MRNTKSLVCLSAVLPLAAAVLASLPAPARACGGFFCNQSGNPFDPPPVVQNGENVLFAVNPNPPAGTPKIEAHIQIFYQGTAAKFSWVLPVDALPTLDTGSDSVFTKLASVTAPQFQVTYHDEGMCKAIVRGPAEDAASAGKSGAGGSAGGGVVNGGVQVAFQGVVGPYDAAVIQSGDAQALLDWLMTAGYYVSDQATGLIETYVAENKYFVALKLTNGQDTKSIRPIILRFDAQAPCVPLRLTAIAASDDMRVNLWVLAANRTVPQNYLEITLNMAKLDWLGGATNYDMLLKSAADEAGGNAFTAEYAGTARIMDGQLSTSGRYNLALLRAAATPPDYLNQLANQGFPRDAALLALLEQFIPEPASLVSTGVAERDFYNQLSFYWSSDMAAFAPFDPIAMTDALDATIVAPMAKTQALFDSFPYLTRLATFISPAEMNTDPIFTFNADLGDVPVVRQADAFFECGYLMYSRCDAPVRLQLPGGQIVRVVPAPMSGACYGYPTGGYPRGDLDNMPSLAVAYQRADSGQGNVLADNTAAISKAIAAHNAALNGGCACSAAGGGAAGAGGLALLAAAAALAARRRRRRGYVPFSR